MLVKNFVLDPNQDEKWNLNLLPSVSDPIQDEKWGLNPFSGVSDPNQDEIWDLNPLQVFLIVFNILIY